LKSIRRIKGFLLSDKSREFENGYKCFWFVDSLNEEVFKEDEIVSLQEYKRILKTEEREDKINKILNL